MAGDSHQRHGQNHETIELEIESLDMQGQGIAHDADGKVVFVSGALPGELVLANITRHKPRYSKARIERVLRASPLRQTPPCPHFGVCGGCSLQHLDPAAQLAIKQRSLEDALAHIAKVRPGQILPAIQGPMHGYRHRARLSVRLVVKKGGVLVGFRERASSYVADMQQCLILPPHVSDLLLPLRDLVGSLSCPDRIPQIELAMGSGMTVFCLRHLQPLTAQDSAKLHDFARLHGIIWWLQPQGPDSAHPLDPADLDALYYELPAYDLRLPFRPTDFTQVNHAINRVMVARALNLLQPKTGDRVLDLFCGLGNFTLPLARFSQQVLGVEGNRELVQRAQQAAAMNGLSGRAQFQVQDLQAVDADWLRRLGRMDAILLDPAREGAIAIAHALAELATHERPARLLYVSCNPATLARDAAVLHHAGGWVMQAAGVIDMFPHTAHVESMAVFAPG